MFNIGSDSSIQPMRQIQHIECIQMFTSIFWYPLTFIVRKFLLISATICMLVLMMLNTKRPILSFSVSAVFIYMFTNAYLRFVCYPGQCRVYRCLIIGLWWAGEFQSNPWVHAFRLHSLFLLIRPHLVYLCIAVHTSLNELMKHICNVKTHLPKATHTSKDALLTAAKYNKNW